MGPNCSRIVGVGMNPKYREMAECIGMILSDPTDPHWDGFVDNCAYSLQTAADEARKEALEEAAKVAEAQKHFDDAGMIRSLIQEKKA